jgi:hypothetical protein
MGTLLLNQAITLGVCITKMHTAVQYLGYHKYESKQAKYISSMSNYRSPKVKVEDQSIDYAATHVGKKYPSP